MTTLINVFYLIGCARNDTFVGSGVSENAPTVQYYAAMGEECCGEDPHPVHGVETIDGGFVLVGKSMDAGGSTNGFMVKVGPDIPEGTTFLESDGVFSFDWSVQIGRAGEFDVVNSVATSDTAVFVAGAKQDSDGSVQRFVSKYDFDGAEVWSMAFPSAQDTESAFESMVFTPSGTLVLAGFSNGERGMIEGFKSYGNPTAGVATVVALSAEQLSGTEAPIEPIWETIYDGYGSIRSIKAFSDGYVFVAPKSEALYATVCIDAVGGVRWAQTMDDHGEATDIAVMLDQELEVGLAITGHHNVDQGIDGSLTMLTIDGAPKWTKHYGNPPGGVNEFEGLDAGDPALIFDECWGIQSTDNGSVILGCGTGIEGCSLMDISCRSDPRTKWRSLLMEIDAEGEELWYRTDSYYFDGEEEAAASASEHIIRTRDGRFVSVVDQDFGIGMMMLGRQ